MKENFESIEPSEEYKKMMDEILKQEEDRTAEYISLDEIINAFNNKQSPPGQVSTLD